MSIVVTVHGTNDGAESDSGAKWWQTESDFCRRFKALGSQRGVDFDVRPFHWDGANSDVARRRAGRRLARMLRAVLREVGQASVVGHSHGGNVIAYALDDPWLWFAYQRGALRIVSIGTPFFTGRRRWVSQVNDVAIRAILSVVLLSLASIGLWLAGVFDTMLPDGIPVRLELELLLRSSTEIAAEAAGDSPFGYEREAGIAAKAGGLLGWMFEHPWQLVAIVLVALAVVLGPATLRLLARALAHLKLRGREAQPAWCAIAHPADEAIALLSVTPTIRLNPMTGAGAARSVRRLTPLIALVSAMLLVASIWMWGGSWIGALPERFAPRVERALTEGSWTVVVESTLGDDVELSHLWSSEEHRFVVADDDIRRAVGEDDDAQARLRERIAEASQGADRYSVMVERATLEVRMVLEDIMAILLLIFTIGALLAVWLIQLLIVALSPVLGGAISFFANRSVTSAMAGAALGEDGEYMLRLVNAAPPAHFLAREIALSESTVEQMYVDADRHAGESLRRMRRTINAAPQRTTGDAFGDLLAHISWRELIHTSYFEADEVAGIVVNGVVPVAPHGGSPRSG